MGAIFLFYMFYFGMLNVSPAYFYKKPAVTFKGHHGYTDIKTNGKEGTVNNYTTFFRNYKSLEFTKNYLLENFPNGTNIAEFGCSTGQKPYSLMILLENQNKDKKYKCTGYDFPEVVEKHNEKLLYGLNAYTREEQVLFDEYKSSHLFDSKDIPLEDADNIKNTFYKYFDKYKPKQLITGDRYKYLKKLIKDNPNSNHPEIVEAKEDLCYFDLIKQSTIVVKANDKAQNLLKIKAGNINDIDKTLKPKENGVVIFQNALYHILCGNELYYDIDDLLKNVDKARQLFKKINKVLPQNGIFVLGNLASDHIYDFNKEDFSHLAYQDGKRIRVYDSSPIHKELIQNGFEPIFFEKVPETTAYAEHRGVYVPSIWKKVREA